MTSNTQPQVPPTRVHAALSSAKVLVPRKEFGALIFDAVWEPDLVEVDGGFHAWFDSGAALLDDDYTLHHWATADEVRQRGQAALRPPRRPRGPMLAIDSATAGAVIAERFGRSAIEAAGYRVVGCGNGIAVLDMRNHLLAWLNAAEMPAAAHSCPHCKCGHAPALPGAAAR